MSTSCDHEGLNSLQGCIFYLVTQYISTHKEFEPLERSRSETLVTMYHIYCALCLPSQESLHTALAQSQGHQSRHWFFGGERNRKRKCWMIFFERAGVNQINIGTLLQAMLGKLQRDKLEHVWAFQSMLIYHLELFFLKLVISEIWCKFLFQLTEAVFLCLLTKAVCIPSVDKTGSPFVLVTMLLCSICWQEMY